MDNFEKTYVLALQKKEKFAAYEEATNKLLECEADTAQQYSTQRVQLATEIDVISEEIGRVCDGLGNGWLVLDALKNKVDYTQLPPEMHMFYDLGQEMRTIVYRVEQTDKRVLARMETFRDEALRKIKKNHHLPKIKKYLTDITDQPDKWNATNSKA